VLKRVIETYLSTATSLALIRHLLTAFMQKKENKKGQRLLALILEEVEDLVEQADADSCEVQVSYTAATAKAVYALKIL
jgi:hypothetical protein